MQAKEASQKIESDRLTGEKQLETANDHKEKGNECIRIGKCTEAVLHYSFAIKLDPSDAALYSNRSLAFLKLKQFYYANEDAKKAIQLKPDWAKVCVFLLLDLKKKTLFHSIAFILSRTCMCVRLHRDTFVEQRFKQLLVNTIHLYCYMVEHYNYNQMILVY